MYVNKISKNFCFAQNRGSPMLGDPQEAFIGDGLTLGSAATLPPAASAAGYSSICRITSMTVLSRYMTTPTIRSKYRMGSGRPTRARALSRSCSMV